MDLSGAALNRTNLSYSNFGRSKLRHANLSGTNLSHADFGRVDLSHADLSSSSLNNAYFRFADFHHANLSNADLRHADFMLTNLTYTNFTGANLTGTNFVKAKLFGTIFVNVKLSEIKGLETVFHQGPSEISLTTLYLCQGKLPEVFLRGCGLKDWEIESAKLYELDLRNSEINDTIYKIYDVRAHQAIQINSLFISYSHTDSLFVDEIEKHLDEKGIRFWRDVHDATAGRLENQIERAIRLNPIVLVVLSADSVKSDWVQHEVRLARRQEINTNRDVLCPIALDDRWKSCHWPDRLREQIMEYNILDFSNWNNKDEFRQMFGRLLEGLDVFYKS
jgi:uncharacterized protein YjbI with pentapeptide repeats